MVKTINIQDFWRKDKDRYIIDVRSPGEHHKGRIPTAQNLPLFTDEERAEVGTIYKQVNKDKALHKGLEIVGVKMPVFVADATTIAPNRKLLIHCWRGGKRSQSMGWLLDLAGFDVQVLAGGYKAYRRAVLDNLGEQKAKMIVLSGKTGTGKTYLLHALREAGEQIIDLEALAHHKGSAFGWIGEQNQPSVEQFENNLYKAFIQLDFNKRIWVENESKGIGTARIPEGFWKQMKAAPLINIELPYEQRVKHLIDVYTQESKADLIASFEKIRKRIGGNNLKDAVAALHKNDYQTATDKALYYYDKTYQYGLQENPSPNISTIKLANYNFKKNAQVLIEFCKHNNL